MPAKKKPATSSDNQSGYAVRNHKSRQDIALDRTEGVGSPLDKTDSGRPSASKSSSAHMVEELRMKVGLCTVHSTQEQST